MSKDSSSSDKSSHNNKKGEAAEILTRRRDKRRHLSSTAIDLRNPLQVLELAVRFDESRQEEEILMEPLEKGKLHDQKQFMEALRFLERQTKPPTTLNAPSSSASKNNENNQNKSSNSINNNNNDGGEEDDDEAWQESPMLDFLCNLLGIPHLRDTEGYPDYAMTPIILSGLLSAARNEISLSSSSNDPVGELVMHCETLRRAAIRRVRNRHFRFQIQRNILPAASFFLLLLLYVQWIRETLASLEHLHFMDVNASCEMYHHQQYRDACYLAEAHLWSTFEDYLLIDTCRNNKEECLRRKFGNGALSLQARFSRQLIPIEDVLDDTTILRRDQFRLGKFPRSQFALPDATLGSNNNNDNNDNKGTTTTTTPARPYRWLGASAPLAAAGSVLDHAQVDQWKFLDLGCGVGGALWHLLPDGDRRSFSYHGISLSRAEIFFAREMVRRQGLQHENIRFDEQSFDEPLPRNAYDVIIAMESLSFSPNLENTIQNIMPSLKPGGYFIIADEFVANLPVALSLGIARKAPSMHTFWHYANLLDTHGCKLQYIREYGLEFQLEGYHTYVPIEDIPVWGFLFYPWLPGRSRRLYQLRHDQDDLYKSFRHRKVDESAGLTWYALIVCRKPEEN